MSDDTPLDGTSDEDILQDAYKRFKRCQDWESDARDNIREDMRFAEGDSRNNYQWPELILKGRQADLKPTLTNNLVRQHNLMVVNDARQHKPGIEIRATGDGATYEAAKAFEGLVRHIENQSNAQVAYDTATYHQVYGGIGYWRVVTDYADDESFDLDIFIRRVGDPMSVYLDPDIQHYDGSDAKFGFVFTDMERREFDKKYPDLQGGLSSPKLAEMTNGDWVTADKVRIAEFYRKVEKADWLIEMPDGTLTRQSELPKEAVEAVKQLGLRRRKIARTEVEHYKIAGSDIIAKAIWPGKYIPLVRVVGEETITDGRLDRKGHTRSMISAQQMMNYFYSAAVENVALQTKSPYIADVRSIEGYEDFWRNANNKNYAYLPYNAVNDTGKEIPPPRREPAPQMAPAFVSGMELSAKLIMDVSGQHQANLGEPSNEKSGVAIQQRQRQGDNATAHYIDHQGQAVAFTGRILVDIIPKVYDTKRVIQILEPDGSRYKVQVDPQHPAPHEQVQNPESPDYDENSISAIFNPTMGSYAVVADIGPSFATKRQDAFNAFSELMAQNQDLVKIAGDLMFRNADFPGADELAERIRRTIPPNLLSDDPNVVPPQVQQLQHQLQAVTQHAQQVLGQADQDAAALKAENAKLKAELADRASRTAIESYRAETDRMGTVGNIDPMALKPIIREMVSQVLGQPALPIMQMHQVEDEMHDATLQAVTTQMQPPPPPPGGADAPPGPG